MTVELSKQFSKEQEELYKSLLNDYEQFSKEQEELYIFKKEGANRL